MSIPNYKDLENPDLLAWDTADYLRHDAPIGFSEFSSTDDDQWGDGDWLGGAVDGDELGNYSQVIAIPGPLLSAEIIQLWRRVHLRIELGLPATSESELIIRATRAELIAQGFGKKVGPGALIIGCLLAVGKAEGVNIQTHPRDIAKDIGVRYQTLLRVRRVALEQINKHGARLGITVD